MERRKSTKSSADEGSGRAGSDLLHHVHAISLALKNWNDTEALKLLRLHWSEIARAIEGPDLDPELPEGIAVVLQRDGAPSARDRIAPFDDVIDTSANDSGRVSPPPLRTFP
jgi:hypothetical protein